MRFENICVNKKNINAAIVLDYAFTETVINAAFERIHNMFFDKGILYMYDSVKNTFLDAYYNNKNLSDDAKFVLDEYEDIVFSYFLDCTSQKEYTYILNNDYLLVPFIFPIPGAKINVTDDKPCLKIPVSVLKEHGIEAIDMRYKQIVFDKEMDYSEFIKEYVFNDAHQNFILTNHYLTEETDMYRWFAEHKSQKNANIIDVYELDQNMKEFWKKLEDKAFCKKADNIRKFNEFSKLLSEKFNLGFDLIYDENSMNYNLNIDPKKVKITEV